MTQIRRQSQRHRKREKNRRNGEAWHPARTAQVSRKRPIAMALALDATTTLSSGRHDWREQYDVVAGDQKPCQSCTAFAVAAAITLQSQIDGNRLSVSPGYLHTCVGLSGERDKNVICASSSDPRLMLEALRDRGWPQEASNDYPYPPTACQVGGPQSQLREFPTINSEAAAKKALGRGPLVSAMRAPPAFFTFRGTVFRSSPSTNATLHTICVIGYDSRGWIILNSNGAEWGDGSGCATINYRSCNLLDFRPGLTKLQAYALIL
ncbi:MAG: C1 family peptidase [Telluria sp.]